MREIEFFILRYRNYSTTVVRLHANIIREKKLDALTEKIISFMFI